MFIPRHRPCKAEKKQTNPLKPYPPRPVGYLTRPIDFNHLHAYKSLFNFTLDPELKTVIH